MMTRKDGDQEEERYGYTHLIGFIGRAEAVPPATMVFNAAFQALGLNWRCVPLSVAEGQLRTALMGLGALGFAGAVLAEPHQREALDYIEECSPAARALGAVRYITVAKGGRLIGDHLLWLGFAETLRQLTPECDGLRPLIIGAGGAAASVVYALARQGLPVTIVDGHIDRAIDLVHRLRHVMDEHSFSVYRWPQDLTRLALEADLIVCTTDFGMWPNIDRSPWPKDLPFPADAVAVDLVPWPDQSRFLRQAQASGIRTVNGAQILAYEAALAVELWTGRPRPVQVMQRVVREALIQQTEQNVGLRQDSYKRAGMIRQAACIYT